jgi:tRNA threonylcarbamoyl adenosine modification protein YeaZ
MNILALDTSMGACNAAVLLADGATQRIVLCEETMARGHAEALMPMVAEVMMEAGLGFAALDLIAATLGPGSFTGVRIAIAAARGFALATGAPLWGTDSLTVMAKAALESGIAGDGKPFAVAVDARGERLYFGLMTPPAANCGPTSAPARGGSPLPDCRSVGKCRILWKLRWCGIA